MGRRDFDAFTCEVSSELFRYLDLRNILSRADITPAYWAIRKWDEWKADEEVLILASEVLNERDA